MPRFRTITSFTFIDTRTRDIQLFVDKYAETIEYVKN